MAFVTRLFARVGESDPHSRSFAPETPGAVKSPQVPGQVPDRSTIPEEGMLPVPPAEGEIRRPLTQYGTAEEIMDVYAAGDLEVTDPLRYEQSPPSYEEQRKAFAMQLRTPVRPSAGFALSAGTRMSGTRMAELAAEAEIDRPFDPGESQ